jgi:NCAIR mutase (PurE)-related protein
VTPERVLELLRQVALGAATPEHALDQLSWVPTEFVRGAATEPAFARLDHHRALRVGHPEVVFCAGKSAAHTVAICDRLVERDGSFLATRADEEIRSALQERFPRARVSELGRVVHLPGDSEYPLSGYGSVLIACAGTADLPVAEEAAACAAAFGNPVDRLYDVGVAGIHRLLEQTAALREAAVLVVVAGMEGALPSVVGGLVRVPVIAVPTSIGYGASFGGLAALLAMLNSCAPGVTVVNIDNGFGAACAATRINQLRTRNP